MTPSGPQFPFARRRLTILGQKSAKIGKSLPPLGQREFGPFAVACAGQAPPLYMRAHGRRVGTSAHVMCLMMKGLAGQGAGLLWVAMGTRSYLSARHTTPMFPPLGWACRCRRMCSSSRAAKEGMGISGRGEYCRPRLRQSTLCGGVAPFWVGLADVWAGEGDSKR